MAKMSAGKKGSRKIGRASRKPKCAKYKLKNQRAWNKLKRILKSNGRVFAEKWAKEYGALGVLAKLNREAPHKVK